MQGLWNNVDVVIQDVMDNNPVKKYDLYRMDKDCNFESPEWDNL